MADNTHIEWTDATWNPITGCSVVSPGCTNCYAMTLAGTRLQHHPSRKGLTVDSKAGPVWNGQVRFNADWLDQPLRWRRPRKIFVCAHGDLFHESVPDDWIDQVFAVMAMCPQHVFQVLTKRPERMRDYLKARLSGDPWAEAADAIADLLGQDDHPAVLEPRDMPLPNVWLGVSAEDQTRADQRIPILLDTPAAIRWVSLEPMLGPVDLTRLAAVYPSHRELDYRINSLTGRLMNGSGPRAIGLVPAFGDYQRLDQVILGGESGPGARPMQPDWVRPVRDQCAAAGVPFLFKQWGAWFPVLPPDHPIQIAAEARAQARPFDLADFTQLTPKDSCWLTPEGDRLPVPDPQPPPGAVHCLLVGKKAAGRLLDGQLHDGYPPTHSSPLGGGGPSPQAMVEGVTHPTKDGASDHG